MDTIVYFYKKRGLQEPETEPVGLKSYLLIRVGLDVGRDMWFGKALPQVAQEREEDDSPGSRKAGGDLDDLSPASEQVQHPLCHPLRALRTALRNRQRQRREQESSRAGEREQEKLLAARSAWLGEAEAHMDRLAFALGELVGEMDSCFCVYEDSLRKILMREPVPEGPDGENGQSADDKSLLLLWRKYFPIEEFHGYTQRFWVEMLLSEAVQPHFVILGTAPCLYDLIEKCAHRMKSLRWILPESDCDEMFIGFIEDFYTEYGLAIVLQPLECRAAWKRLQLACELPANILDFTGEAYMAAPRVPEGTIWLDMFSVEEKRRRFAARGIKVTYCSLKEKWKSAQKRCNCPVLP